MTKHLPMPEVLSPHSCSSAAAATLKKSGWSPIFLIQSGGKWIYLKIVYVGFLDSSILYIYNYIYIYT